MATGGREVWIVDVAPRDGLQNDPAELTVEEKVELVSRLLAAGVYRVEVGSFVSLKWVPKMADTEEVVRGLDPAWRERCTCLIPNERGYDRALAAGLRDVRAVVAASATMNRKNFGCDPEDTLAEIARIARCVQEDGLRLGVVVATAFGCPYEGEVPDGKVLDFVRMLLDLGVRELILADTTGVGVPPQVAHLCQATLEVAEGRGVEIGVHLHNTRNTGYANAFAAWEAGIRLFDASLGGIGGCPFAPRSTGNVATEDLAYMFERSGIRTGIDLAALIRASDWLAERLGHGIPSLLPKAGLPWEGVYPMARGKQRGSEVKWP